MVNERRRLGVTHGKDMGERKGIKFKGKRN